MTKFGMIIDPASCTGCNACRVACQLQWQLPPEMTFNRLEYKEIGTYPRARLEAFPVQCQHCDNPPCLHVCPTKATYKRSDGIVLVDHKKCIGCKYCMVACPYGARTMDKEKHIPEKCKFCADFVVKGEMPPCTSTCMNDVRVFGDLDDPDSKVSKLLARSRFTQLLAEKGTKPRIYYLKK